MTSLSLSERILSWYDQNARQLPWRTPSPHPYSVWISEIMLQQTTVATVIPYFLRFMHRFPTVDMLAKASLDDVFFYWQGLGYYGRARRLLLCAQRLLETGFPKTPEEWEKLPGIGPYTAAAICSIVYDYPVLGYDGNIIRIFSRQWMRPVAKGQKKYDASVFSSRPGDFIQGLMDLGSLICRPQQPLCIQCPIKDSCLAYQHQVIEQYPPPQVKKEKPIKQGHALLMQRRDGALWVCRETKQELLKGLYGVPIVMDPPTSGFRCKGHVRHSFTHFHWHVTIWHSMTDDPVQDGQWIYDLTSLPFSTLMRKILCFTNPFDIYMRPTLNKDVRKKMT